MSNKPNTRPEQEALEADDDGEEIRVTLSMDEDGNPSLENIEDEEEFEAVSDCFDELLDEAEWDALLEDDD